MSFVSFSTAAKLTWRLAWRQLVSDRSFAFSMIINMALGLTGYLAVSGFNRSFLQEIRSRTRQIAGGDVVVSSRQPWSTKHLELISENLPSGAQASEEVSLVSMLSTKNSTRLVELRFVDDQFPLYGGVELRDQGKIAPGQASKMVAGDIWIYRELQSQLALSSSDEVKIGEGLFRVRDVVIDDPSSGSGGFSFAPRVFLRMSDLASTKLLGLGSRSLFIHRLKFPSESDSDAYVATLKKRFSKDYPNLDIRVQGHNGVTQETARLYTYLNDYLELICLVALFLAAVGAAYLIRGHLDDSVREFAIMSSLGASYQIPIFVFVLQSLILGIGASLLAVMLSSIALPFLAAAMAPFTGELPALRVPVGSVFQSGLVAISTGLLLSLPQLIRLQGLSPTFLFQESQIQKSDNTILGYLGYLPAIFLWWLAAVYQSRSWSTGSMFAGLCIALAVFLGLISLPLTRVAIYAARLRLLNWKLSLALRMLSRNRVATITTFMALALGATLINLVPQLKAVIAREIARPDSTIPQVFMFDIQDEQLASLKDFFEKIGAKVGGFHPMVRARLESINGQTVSSRKMNFEGEREQQQREALQTRTQNLSYRDHLSSAETVTQGEFITKNFEGVGIPALSVEEGFAQRVDVKLGDRLQFDVMGVMVEGEVKSIRRVRWTSFEPNFMILFQPGVLDAAPKIWVASASQIGESMVDTTIASLVRQHPNVSVVDIKSAVRRLLVFIDKMGTAISIVAWIALLGGVGVLYSIAQGKAASRAKSIALLKALGATARDAQISVLFEYAIISASAIVFGVGLGIAVSWGITVYVLRAPWGLADLSSAINGIVILPVCLVLAWIATRGSVKKNIITLLS